MPDLTKHDPRDHDTSYTPFEKKRREGMRVRSYRYGFYRVATEPVEFPKCETCAKSLYSAHTVINGKHYCNGCMSR